MLQWVANWQSNTAAGTAEQGTEQMIDKVTIGSVSTGTLRDEDLLAAFAFELERLADNYPELVDRANQFVEDGFTDGEASSNCVAELMDALSEYAPPHVYFGAHEGDGADFGFWPDMDFSGCEFFTVLEPDVRDPSDFEPGSELVDTTCGIYVSINDHGNVTVSEIRGAEIWSAV